MNGYVLTPSGNGLHLLSHKQTPAGRPPSDSFLVVDNSIALNAHCNIVRWHHQFGHRNMHNLMAQHTDGVPTTPALPSSLTNVSCD
jgi:hypothetical protein